MTRKLILLLIVAFSFLLGTAKAQDARALYTETSLGGGLWRYDYTFYNDLSPLGFSGFNLYDVSLTLDGATVATSELVAPNWSSIITTDFVEYFSVLAGAPPAGSDIPPGGMLGGFRFVADKQLGDLAFAAIFTDPGDPQNPRIYGGISASTAPEPASLPFTALGVIVLFTLRSKKHSC